MMNGDYRIINKSAVSMSMPVHCWEGAHATGSTSKLCGLHRRPGVSERIG